MYGVFNVAPLRESAARRQSTEQQTAWVRILLCHFQALPLTSIEVRIQTHITRKIRDSTPRGVRKYYYIWFTLVAICKAHTEVPGIQYFVIVGYFYCNGSYYNGIPTSYQELLCLSWIKILLNIWHTWSGVSLLYYFHENTDVDEDKEDNQSSLIYFQWVTRTVPHPKPL